MKATPLVSIIINNYNYEQFLPAAIDSAIAQTYSPKEIIVVDDGSTDGSREIIGQYADKITPCFQANGKQGAALNTGFSASHGEIIFFLDADDYLLPHAVEKVVDVWTVETFKAHFRLRIVDGEGNPSNKYLPPTTMELASGDVRTKILSGSGYISTPMSGNAYSRERLANLFPIPPQYNTTADDYLMISSPFYGEIVGIEEYLGAYRIHGSNQWALTTVSGSRFRRFVSHDLQNYALLIQRAKEFDIDIPSDLESRGIGRIWSRLASLKLEPKEHPVESDSVLHLLYWGIRCLWKYANYNFPKKIIYTFLFLWVALTPTPLSKLGITWLYAPHLRPKFIDNTLTKLRTLVS
ncbi:MAG: glycosyltransferase family 2 protein [Cyanobacteria bacterium J06621_11]